MNLRNFTIWMIPVCWAVVWSCIKGHTWIGVTSPPSALTEGQCLLFSLACQRKVKVSVSRAVRLESVTGLKFNKPPIRKIRAPLMPRTSLSQSRHSFWSQAPWYWLIPFLHLHPNKLCWLRAYGHYVCGAVLVSYPGHPYCLQACRMAVFLRLGVL